MKKPTKFLLASLLPCIFAVSSFAQSTTEEKQVTHVTAAQYCDFLNHAAISDPHHLYDEAMIADPLTACIKRLGLPGSYHYEVLEGRESALINYVSSFNEARYCNWLQNCKQDGEQGFNSTEEGVYDLNGINEVAADGKISKNKDAKYFICDDKENNDPLLKFSQRGFHIVAPGTATLMLAAASTTEESSNSYWSDAAGVAGFIGLVAFGSAGMLEEGHAAGLASPTEQRFLTLNDFRSAAEAHPTVSRFIIKKEGGITSIVPQEADPSTRVDNRNQNIEITRALSAAIEKDHSLEIAERIIPSNNNTPPDLKLHKIFNELNQLLNRKARIAASKNKIKKIDEAIREAESKEVVNITSNEVNKIETISTKKIRMPQSIVIEINRIINFLPKPFIQDAIIKAAKQNFLTAWHNCWLDDPRCIEPINGSIKHAFDIADVVLLYYGRDFNLGSIFCNAWYNWAVLDAEKTLEKAKNRVNAIKRVDEFYSLSDYNLYKIIKKYAERELDTATTFYSAIEKANDVQNDRCNFELDGQHENIELGNRISNKSESAEKNLVNTFFPRLVEAIRTARITRALLMATAAEIEHLENKGLVEIARQAVSYAKHAQIAKEKEIEAFQTAKVSNYNHSEMSLMLNRGQHERSEIIVAAGENLDDEKSYNKNFISNFDAYLKLLDNEYKKNKDEKSNFLEVLRYNIMVGHIFLDWARDKANLKISEEQNFSQRYITHFNWALADKDAKDAEQALNNKVEEIRKITEAKIGDLYF
ncbi:MAG: hypothetical protein ACH346_07370 [Chthoniobacterales bacterium]